MIQSLYFYALGFAKPLWRSAASVLWAALYGFWMVVTLRYLLALPAEAFLEAYTYLSVLSLTLMLYQMFLSFSKIRDAWKDW